MKISNNEYKKYRLYGTIGMVALFLMGALVGFILNGADRINHSIMTQEQCEYLSVKMQYAVENNNYEAIGQLNKIYSENCLDRNFNEPKPQQKAEGKLSEEQCRKLYGNIVFGEPDNPYLVHLQEFYQENCQEYGVFPEIMEQAPNKLPKTTCGQIERILLRRIYPVDNPDSPAHVDNAKIYANLSERGCPENSEKYKQLAKQELEIARALNDDDMEDRHETTEIVETYKRLQMQQEAERMIEKAKKLTNPAIDFIIQLEKIIDED